MLTVRPHTPRALDAEHALRGARCRGDIEAIYKPGDVDVLDWYFEPELPKFMFIPGFVATSRRSLNMGDGWREELPYINRKPGTGLANPLNCYFVDPRAWEALVIVTSPYVHHDYRIGSSTLLERRYPQAMFLRRVDSPSRPIDNERHTITVFIPPETVRTLKLVSERDFIEGVI